MGLDPHVHMVFQQISQIVCNAGCRGGETGNFGSIRLKASGAPPESIPRLLLHAPVRRRQPRPIRASGRVSRWRPLYRPPLTRAVGYRSAWTYAKRFPHKWRPLPALELGATCEHFGACEIARVPRVCFAAIVGHAVTDRAYDGFAGCRVPNASDDRLTVLYERDRDGPLGQPCHELTCAVEWVHDPDPSHGKSCRVIEAFLGEPPSPRRGSIARNAALTFRSASVTGSPDALVSTLFGLPDKSAKMALARSSA